RASFPPMPSPATSDRRAASYLARLREWRRQDRTSLLHRSGSTRVSSSRSTSAAAAPERPLQRRQTAERIIAHGYRSDHLYDRLLATSRDCRALCAGVWRRPRSYDPMAVAGKLSEPRRLRQYLRRKLRAPKASASGRRVGRDGHLTNRQFCERAKWVERFWLQSVSRGNRLLAASGFKYVRCNGSPDVSS